MPPLWPTLKQMQYDSAIASLKVLTALENQAAKQICEVVNCMAGRAENWRQNRVKIAPTELSRLILQVGHEHLSIIKVNVEGFSLPAIIGVRFCFFGFFSMMSFGD